MRRANASDPEEGPQPKKQATMAAFYKRADGSEVDGPRFVPDDHRMKCPFCDFTIKSQYEAKLAGPMKIHCELKHKIEYAEAQVRLAAAERLVQSSIFDFEPLPTIPEESPEENGRDNNETPAKPKILRHSYSIKDKYRLLKDFEATEQRLKENLAPGDAIFAVSVLEIVHRASGVPISTIKDWLKEKNEITQKYLSDKKARRIKRMGSGKKALFPQSEKKVAEMVRDRRRACKLVSKAFILKNLKAEAQIENSVAFSTCKWSPDMISAFMRRNKFSLRFPSCIRAHSLEDSILIGRAYHRRLLGILSDSGDLKYAKKPLDPQYGRFLLNYRFNGDEVPFRFGRVKSVVSLAGENVTQVTWPAGWEARLATIFLLMDANGRIVLLVLIFQGTFNSSGKRRATEEADIARKCPHVKVLFQKKAWMDGEVLRTITKKHFLPYLRNLWAGDGVDFAESLLLLDNGPGRTDEQFLKCLKEDCNALLEKLPPNETHNFQMIDDNCGRIYRDLACDYIDERVAEMAQEELATLSMAQKRLLMSEAAEYAFSKWMDPDNEYYRQIGQRAALRTGLAMRIDNNCAGVQPVRFPASYPQSIPSSTGAPVQAYFVERVVAAQPALVNVQIPPTTENLVVNVVQHPNGEINVGMQGDGAVVRVERAVAQQVHEEVAIFDGWASEEEDRVFLEEEVDASESSDESEDDGPRRLTQRRRWCLFGCDCERPRGRKCFCEKQGSNLCSSKCGCDPEKCRARLQADQEDD
jgi:hypothetical protein